MLHYLKDVKWVRFKQQGTWNRKKDEAENLPSKNCEIKITHQGPTFLYTKRGGGDWVFFT